MIAFVSLYSDKKEELNKFLSSFYNINLDIKNKNSWEKEYKNPIEIAEIIGAYIDNINNYKINMWISLDEGVMINITEKNGDDVIKYLYERFPY